MSSFIPDCTDDYQTTSPSPDLSLWHSTHLAISTNIQLIINETELGFQASLSFKLSPSANTTSSLQTPQRKKKMGEISLTQTNHHYTLSKLPESLMFLFTKCLHIFPLPLNSSQFSTGIGIYCLMSVLPQTDSQLLPASESSYTLLPE